MSMQGTGSPSGSLVEHGSGCRGYLSGLGSSASTAHKHPQLLVALSRWLEREGIYADELAAASTGGSRRAQGRLGAVTGHPTTASPSSKSRNYADPLTDSHLP
jgi:hypothetical protein